MGDVIDLVWSEPEKEEEPLTMTELAVLFLEDAEEEISLKDRHILKALEYICVTANNDLKADISLYMAKNELHLALMAKPEATNEQDTGTKEP